MNPSYSDLTISTGLTLCTASLKHFVSSPRSEAEQIVSYHLQISRRTELYVQSQKKISTAEWQSIAKTIRRRKEGEPLQYILGISYFWNLPFTVNTHVLIPRPETELMVEYVCCYYANAKRILDIGTGSGCIAVALAKENPDFQIDAIDISPEALKIAKLNAEENQVNIQLFQSDLFSCVAEKYDVIISNPPYISDEEYRSLPYEIAHYEPNTALLANDSGLEFYKKIIAEANSFLTKQGVIILEIGAEQALSVKTIAQKNGFTEIQVKKDLNQFDRFMIIKKRK